MTEFPGFSVRRPNAPTANGALLPPTATALPHLHPELPRLQVPSLPIVQPAFPAQTHLHWKLQAQAPLLAVPPSPQQPHAMSRMRMVANFFSSEANRQNQNQPSQSPVPAPTTPMMLPSLQEILGRTKQMYIATSPVVNTVTPEMAEPVPSPMAPTPTFPSPAFSLHAPTPLNIRAGMPGHAPGLYRSASESTTMSLPMTPLPSPSESMSPSSQSGKASKRRERWTEDEHARFMEGLNRYGRKWKKIQACVKTKTAVQVRTHAYGYFAKLLRNMPEDDAAWELAEEMSSLPGAVLKGPASGKRRSEPKTDEAGMEVLRRFVFCRKKSDSVTTRSEDADMETASVSSIQSLLTDETNPNASAPGQQTQAQPPHHARWGPSEQWNSDEASTDAVASDLKRQRLH